MHVCMYGNNDVQLSMSRPVAPKRGHKTERKRGPMEFQGLEEGSSSSSYISSNSAASITVTTTATVAAAAEVKEGVDDVVVAAVETDAAGVPIKVAAGFTSNTEAVATASSEHAVTATGDTNSSSSTPVEQLAATIVTSTAIAEDSSS